MQCTHTETITMPDGTTQTHTAEALGYRHMADGVIAVLASCCGLVGGLLCDGCNGIGCAACGHRGVTGQIVCPTCNGQRVVDGLVCPNCNGRGEIKMEDTRSWHTFYDCGMPVSDGAGGILPPVDPVAEVQQHVQNVASRHAARSKAKVSGLDGLMKPKALTPKANQT